MKKKKGEHRSRANKPSKIQRAPRSIFKSFRAAAMDGEITPAELTILQHHD